MISISSLLIGEFAWHRIRSIPICRTCLMYQMNHMLNLRKPAFIFSVVAIVLFFIGLYMLTEDQKTGSMLMYIGLGMAAIYWIWSIIDVLTTTDLKPFQKKFWFIIVFLVPAFGGALYHLMHQERKKIVT
jgi:hypothetical protein